MPVRLAIRKMPITMIAVMQRQPTAIRRASHQSLKIEWFLKIWLKVNFFAFENVLIMINCLDFFPI